MVLEGDLRREIAANLNASGDQLLSWHPPPSRPPGPRPAHQHQRPHPQGPRKTVGVSKAPRPKNLNNSSPWPKKSPLPRKRNCEARAAGAPDAAAATPPRKKAKGLKAAADKALLKRRPRCRRRSRSEGRRSFRQTRRDDRWRREAAHRRNLLKEELGTIKVRKAKGSKNVVSGYANVLASFNNTIVSITDHKGAVIAWSSAGKCNFRGSRKSTAYAAQVVAQDAARNAMSHGFEDIQIRVSGPGLGRDSAIRALQAIGLEITSIVDVTPIRTTAAVPANAVASNRRV